MRVFEKSESTCRKTVLSSGNQQELELFDALSKFIEIHEINDCYKLKILKCFASGEHIDTINKALSWSGTEQGYEFFYFLALRWAKYLVLHFELYKSVYCVGDAIQNLENLLDFCSYDYSNDYWLTSYKKEYEVKHRYYGKLLRKYEQILCRSNGKWSNTTKLKT